ncbi:hypothetical protein AB0I54_45755 [Streptomyces sp. NPDC050625]|uniref:hypothetical protein n=1 Tax=Streptomyces sp. NPDC050625 TaxID=3154629 RepID=UPI00341C07A9
MTRREKDPTAPLNTLDVPTGRTVPARVQLSPDVEHFSWGNEYVQLTPVYHRVEARLHLYAGQEQARTLVRTVTPEVDLRSRRVVLPVQMPADLRHRRRSRADGSSICCWPHDANAHRGRPSRGPSSVPGTAATRPARTPDAVADRVDDLYNLVCDPAFLAMAWERVAGNKGPRSAGVDGMTGACVRERIGEAQFLAELRKQLKSRSFRPVPVRERMIPKPGSRKRRRLGIPTVADRVVQASLKLVLEPIFEADFAPCSYGFCPNRRAHDAMAETRFLASKTYEWVLEGDIRPASTRSRIRP